MALASPSSSVNDEELETSTTIGQMRVCFESLFRAVI